jgi:hypothetical protein
MNTVSCATSVATTAVAIRRLASTPWASRLSKESSCVARSGSTAPPWVRLAWPASARIARSRRAVIGETLNSSSTVATVTLPRWRSSSRIWRRRSAGTISRLPGATSLMAQRGYAAVTPPSTFSRFPVLLPERAGEAK